MKSISLTQEEQREMWAEVKRVVGNDFEGDIDEWGGEPVDGEVLKILMKAYLGQLSEIPNHERPRTVQDGERER